MRSLFPILILAPLSVYAAEASKPVQTIAGDLAILHNEPIQIKIEDEVCAVKVGGKLVFIHKCDSEGEPTVIANLRRKATDGDERQVLVIQRNPAGNGCNGGPLTIIEVSQKYDAIVSPQLDFCGGADPVITQNAKGILITFPGGPANHGAGKIPTERWQYQGGTFVKAK